MIKQQPLPIDLVQGMQVTGVFHACNYAAQLCRLGITAS